MLDKILEQNTDHQRSCPPEVENPSNNNGYERAEVDLPPKDFEATFTGVDIRGALKLIRAPKSKPLLPLFEIISNAVDAIEDANRLDGRIEVFILREDSLFQAESLTSIQPEQSAIIGFRVEDNGIGFIRENCLSFCRYASTFKEQRGGLGVGRFLLLKAFFEVNISSTFIVDGGYCTRAFTFSETCKGIPQAIPAQEPVQRTSVTLNGLRKGQVDPPPNTSAVIANRIVEHFLNYFVNGKMPDIVLIDDDATKPGDKEIDLHQVFSDRFKIGSEKIPFDVGEHTFELALFRLSDTIDVRDHRLHLCADGREVTNEKLSTMFPDLVKRIGEENPFFLSVYVSGELLDEKKNWDRMDFDFEEPGESGGVEDLSFSGLTSKDFRKAIAGVLEDRLQEYLKPLRESKIETITKYIHERAPRYAPLLKACKAELAALKPTADERALDQSLSRLQFDHLKQMNRDFQNILSQDVGCIRDEEYRRKLDHLLSSVSDVGRAQLAEYVTHRKVVVKLLAKAMANREADGFALEDYVHELICPRYKTSNDILPVEAMNLWLLDERLAFHNFLASEKQHRQLDPVQHSGQKRTDIFILKTPLAFTDAPYPFHSVIIVEFKRPQRDDYTAENNPIKQVLDYIDDFESGTITDCRGRKLPPKERCFFGYVVADETKSLAPFLKDDYETLDDGLGYFRYYNKRRAYLQVITFDKLLQDAEIRNRILFEKLGIDE